MCGDTICFSNCDGVDASNVTTTVVAYPPTGLLATDAADRPQCRFGSRYVLGARVGRFQEKPEGQKDWVNGGFFLCSPQRRGATSRVMEACGIVGRLSSLPRTAG